MYSIFRGADLIGRSRLERAGLLLGDAEGVFEPARGFRALRDRILPIDRSGAWPDLEVVSPDGRTLNARVDGFAETGDGAWIIGVTVNDEEYWRRAADGTL